MPPPAARQISEAGHEGSVASGTCIHTGSGGNNNGDNDTPNNQSIPEDNDQEQDESGRDIPAPPEDRATKLARLRELVAAKREEQEIEDLERELAGGRPAYSAALGSVVPTQGHKRGISDTAEMPPSIHRRLGTPPTFSGKDIAELRIYDASWRARFKAMPAFATEEARVLEAAASLRGDAIIEWGNLTLQAQLLHSTTWTAYMEWCRSAIWDSTNRAINASKKLKDCVQKDGQSVKDLVRYIEEVERDLDPEVLGTESVRGYRILNALRDELRTEVIKGYDDDITRGGVISIATRYEEIFDSATKRHFKQEINVPTQISALHQRVDEGTAAARTLNASSPSAAKFNGSCHYCKKKGHKAIDCFTRKREAAMTKTEPLKNESTKP